MKKFYYNIAVALMAVLSMTAFTSCENDEQIAYDLSGEWEGYMGESFYDYWGYENYAEYYTVIRFYRDGHSSYRYGASTGEGEQIDYVNGSNYRPYYRYFTWEVDWGTIYIKYDNGEQVRIYNYNINGRYFRGTMKYYDRWSRELSVADFDFRKTTNFDWDYYYEWSQQPAAMKNDSIVITK
jgi:hypothetical protein